MAALFDCRKLFGAKSHKKTMDYYRSIGVVDLLLQYAKERISQKEQCDRLNAAGLKTVKNTAFTQPRLSRIISKLQSIGYLPTSIS